MPRLQFQLQAPVTFCTDLAIYISHVNQGGHLDHAQLLTLLSEARVRFFLSLGYREGDVEGCPIVVGDLGVQYLSEGFHGETMRIEMAPAERSRCGFDLQFRMSERDSGREVARGKTGIVFTDRATRRAVPVPPAFLARLGLA
ncbi:MAG: thioesterase family protein [Burkholderiaceae bacterium]|nr:thioesterase family protein [Burkholderiaceae bacterium]